MALIICASTGTVLDAQSCILVQDDAISDDELDSRSDSEIAALAKERGMFLSSFVPLSPKQP